LLFFLKDINAAPRVTIEKGKTTKNNKTTTDSNALNLTVSAE
jgi:hypothetical protein